MSGRRLTFTHRDKWIFIPVAVIATINFMAFWILGVYLGGDAISGYSRDGQYFLCSHGVYTEVSQTVWRYSYLHTVSVWVTYPLIFISAAILFLTGDMKLR
jgi:hypothetical protein